jgi:FkbM family methyltransferase
LAATKDSNMIVSTTLAGPGAEHIIGDALKSVVQSVDLCLVAFAGCDVAATDAAIRSAITTNFSIRQMMPWPGRYDHARQFMLDWAGQAGADWAVTVDTDERVTLHPEYRAKMAAATGVNVWMLRDKDEGYAKERILKCGAGLKWHGRVCENVIHDGPAALMDGHFTELKKDDAAERRRWERGVIECKRMIEEDGDDRYKWWRHLGTCLTGLGRMDEGLDAYENALKREHGPEDEAWCTYLICELLVLSGRLQEAHDRAAMGLAKHAGFLPEFGWILSYTQMRGGELQNASRWAQLVVHGPKDQTRIGHRGKNCITGAKQALTILHNKERPPGVLLRGVKIPIHPRFSDFMVKVMLSESYERAEADMLEGLLRPDDRVLDLGAGCGFLSTLAAKKLAPGAVMAVEADPDLVEACAATFGENDVMAELVHAAVAATEAPVHLTRTRDFWSNKLAPEAGECTVEVQGKTFRDLLNAHNPTVIICDIEGAERYVAGHSLAAFVRAVLIECHSAELERGVTGWLVDEGFFCTKTVERTLLFSRPT